MFTIKAKKRDKTVKSEDLKKAGEIPAVFYGSNKETTSISVPLVDFKKVWSKAGESSAVKVELGNDKLDVLIHDVQLHPISGEPIHVDLLVIDMNKAIQVSVPLEFTGVSSAVKGGLGILVKVLYEVEIEALPSDLPQNISVDISKLNTVDDVILASDISLPKGVTLVTKDSEVVASIAVQQEEKEDTTPVYICY